MKKEILILTGSPRKNGNTESLAAAFAKGAKAKGHSVTIFNASKNIGGCQACDTCWSKGRACTFIDAFTDLEPLLEKADTLVLASPVYWFGFSSQIKAAIDRLYAYFSEKALRPLKIKESALLLCAGDENESVFEGIILSNEIALKYLEWSNAGVLAVTNVMDKGDILKTDALERAEKFGSDF